jgi:chromosome segregation ATPase
MSGDTERQMAFILDQQARFNSDIMRLDERIDKNTGQISNMVDALMSLTNIVERYDSQVAALVEQGKDTDSRLKALVAQGKKTDSRLNALIGVVERLIADRGAGK